MSKRLAQCLNPALPSGVHQKALETYAIIFEKLGRQKLISDFHIYSYGILPFFRHCSLAVRNTYLSIYKKYLLPLCSDLPSCLKSLVLSLLPGLEEDGNEHFDQASEMNAHPLLSSSCLLSSIFSLFLITNLLALLHCECR